LSLRSIKAGFIIAFVTGIIFLALGIYGAYFLFTVELPSGHISKLPLAVIGCTLFGAIMVVKSYPIFVPLKKNSDVMKIVCPSCGALVDEDTEVCEKCKRPLDQS
jgi:ribosomal protein L40E